MNFKFEVKERLNRIDMRLNRILEILNGKPTEITRLEKQNKDLMDRFMAIDFEKYISMTPDRWESAGKKAAVDISPLTDISMAGEILSQEDIDN